jgi:hypothetical protein
MPFKSEAQRRFMHANHPKIAAEFEKETPKDAELPKYVKGSAAAQRRVNVSRGLRKAFPPPA